MDLSDELRVALARAEAAETQLTEITKIFWRERQESWIATKAMLAKIQELAKELITRRTEPILPEQNLLCPNGCCRFVNGQPASETEFKAAQNLAGNEKEIRITCLKIDDNKAIAEAVGFYCGNLEWSGKPFLPGLDMSALAPEYFAFDIKTNACLGPLTADQNSKWSAVRKKLIDQFVDGEGADT